MRSPLSVAALKIIPNLPRPLLERLVERAIERLDELDGDPDVEFNGDEFDLSYVNHDHGITWQSLGTEDDERDERC